MVKIIRYSQESRIFLSSLLYDQIVISIKNDYYLVSFGFELIFKKLKTLKM